MAESSPLQSVDEQNLLQAALEHPFEPTEVPLSPSTTSSSAPALPVETASSPGPSTEDDAWQSTYASQVSEWRVQSASARTKAELTRTEWEAIRAREAAERSAHGQPPESWDHLGDHITASTTAANEVVAQSRSQSLSASPSQLTQSHMQPDESQYPLPHPKTESGSPNQPWEHISASPTSSYPSMSFPDASLPQSPTHYDTLLPHTSDPVPPETHPGPKVEQGPPSTLPSIMDNRVAPRTRLSLVLSSLAINLFLPFINGVMLGFGEIFAKDVLVGWLGWKTTRPGSTAARLGIRP